MTDQYFNAEVFHKAMKTLDPTPEEAAKRAKMREFLEQLTSKPRQASMQKSFDANYGGDAFPKKDIWNGLEIVIQPPGDEEKFQLSHEPFALRYQPKRGMSLSEVSAALAKQMKALGIPVKVSIQSGVNRSDRRRQARKDGSVWRKP